MGQKSHRRASKSVMLSFCITHAGLRVARQAGRVHVALGAVGDSRGRQWGEKSSKSICKGYNVVLDRLGGCASSETGWEGARGPGCNQRLQRAAQGQRNCLKVTNGATLSL